MLVYHCCINVSVVCSPGPWAEGAFVQTQTRDTRNPNQGCGFCSDKHVLVTINTKLPKYGL